MDEDRDAYLDRVLIGGREARPVHVVDHDARWAAWFAATADLLRAALGERARRVEHIGSTSVPGLAAKPILDVLVTVDDVDDEAAYVPVLETAGFVLRVREPGHRMLRTRGRDVHVHVFAPEDPEVRAVLDLRDWLRVDRPDRELYAATKRRLAQRTWRDMNDYAAAKSDVIQEILGRAGEWRAGARAPRGGGPVSA